MRISKSKCLIKSKCQSTSFLCLKDSVNMTFKFFWHTLKMFRINLQQNVPFGKLARLPETFSSSVKKVFLPLCWFCFWMEGHLFCCTWMLNRYLSPQTTKKWPKKTGGWILFQRSEMVGGVILGKMHGHLWEKPVWDSHLIHQSRPCP